MLRRWSGARSAAIEVFHSGVDFVNAHFALYAFPWLGQLPPRVPLIVHFHGPWSEEMRVEAGGFKKRLYFRIERCRLEASSARQTVWESSQTNVDFDCLDMVLDHCTFYVLHQYRFHGWR